MELKPVSSFNRSGWVLAVASCNHLIVTKSVSPIASFSKELRHTAVTMELKPGPSFNRSGWVLAVAAFIHLTVTYGIISSFVVLFVSLEEEFGSSAVATGWMGSMAWGVASMFSPFSAIMFLHWGHQVVACLGVLCCTTGLLVTSFLPNLWYMYVSFGFVFAAGTNMLNNASFHLTALHFPGRKGVRPFAFISLSGGVSLLAGTALIDVCIKSIGWRITYAIFSGILFVVCLPLCYFYKKPAPCNISLTKEEEKYTELKQDSTSSRSKHMLAIEEEQLPVRSSSTISLAVETYGYDTAVESATDTTTSCQYRQLEDGDKTSSSSGVKVFSRNLQRRHVDEARNLPRECEHETLDSKEVSKDLSCAQEQTPPSHDDCSANESELKDGEDPVSDEVVIVNKDYVVDSVDEGCLNRKCAFVKVPGLWMAAIGTMTTSAASVFNVINLVSYMQMIGMKDRTSVLLILGLGLAEMFGRVVYFLLGSSLPVSGITTMAVVNLAGAGVSLCLALFPKLETIIVYIIVAGLARGIFYTINLPSCLELFKGLESAVVITFMMVGNGLGGLLSSTCAGLSVDITGSYKVAFFTCTGLYFTSFLLFGSLRLWPRVSIPEKNTAPQSNPSTPT